MTEQEVRSLAFAPALQHWHISPVWQKSSHSFDTCLNTTRTTKPVEEYFLSSQTLPEVSIGCCTRLPAGGYMSQDEDELTLLELSGVSNS